MRIWQAVVVLALATGACGDGPSCEDVARHIDELARRDAGSSGATAATHDVMVRNCEAERSHNRTLRDCVMKATNLMEAKGCELAAIRR